MLSNLQTNDIFTINGNVYKKGAGTEMVFGTFLTSCLYLGYIEGNTIFFTPEKHNSFCQSQMVERIDLENYKCLEDEFPEEEFDEEFDDEEVYNDHYGD